MSTSSPASPSPALHCRLPTWNVIAVSGDDARAFLHGQLSNDLLNLAPDAAQWTAYCSPKGRMLAGFLAWNAANGDVMLACDRSIAAGVVKRLRMFVLRSKVKIEDLGDRWSVAGRIGEPGGPAPLRVEHLDGTTRIGLPDVDGASRVLQVQEGASDATSAGDETAWRRAMIRAGESWITLPTQDQFVPQMVNFDALGGINFKKGCYPGQEVVARAHYRGAVKRRMYRATVRGAAAGDVTAGQALFSAGANAQECGQVVNAVAGEAGTVELLAVLSMQSREESAIHLGAADGPLLAFAGLPYAVPEAA